MDSKAQAELAKRLDDLTLQIPELPWRETAMMRHVALGMGLRRALELRITSEAIDLELAEQASTIFFSAFFLYPTSIAVHSTIAALLEASEITIKASCRFVDEGVVSRRVLGSGFVASPIHIEVDDSLDTKTVAVRYKINFDEYRDAAMKVTMDAIGARKAERMRDKR